MWGNPVIIIGPVIITGTNNYHRDSLQFLQPFSIDSADFPCRSPAISSPCSFYGQNICSAVICLLSFKWKKEIDMFWRDLTLFSLFFTIHLALLITQTGVNNQSDMNWQLKYIVFLKENFSWIRSCVGKIDKGYKEKKQKFVPCDNFIQLAPFFKSHYGCTKMKLVKVSKLCMCNS